MHVDCNLIITPIIHVQMPSEWRLNCVQEFFPSIKCLKSNRLVQCTTISLSTEKIFLKNPYLVGWRFVYFHLFSCFIMKNYIDTGHSVSINLLFVCIKSRLHSEIKRSNTFAIVNVAQCTTQKRAVNNKVSNYRSAQKHSQTTIIITTNDWKIVNSISSL